MADVSLKEIVVPFDGSELSEMAVPYGEEIARRLGGRVTLVRAMPEPAMVTDIPKRVVDGVKAAAHAELEAAVKRCAPAIPVDTVLKVGFPVEVVLAAAAGRDLIVMTTNGRGGLSRFLMGSVTEKIIRLSPIPVLVIRPLRSASRPAAVTGAKRLLRDVAVPLDRSELALDAVRPLAAAAGSDTRIHVLTVIPREADERTANAAADYLAARVTALEARGLPVVTRLLHHDSPAEAIGAYAEAQDCGLIVMSSHGAGGFREWMLGSVTDQTIRRGPVPVLVVPSAGRAANPRVK
ncbi:MAG: universal stress protein [Planctomycetes bacterium]|nr:universal stress protein [Planctomycetota bacterium]